MTQFAAGHATHPNWQACVELVLAQIAAAPKPKSGFAALGLVYVTDHFSSNTQAIVALLRERLPQVQAFAGAVGVGVCGNNAEYIDEPALSLMLCVLPQGSFKVFSGVSPLGKFSATTALVHADGNTPDLGELIGELASRTQSGQVFGGLAASRKQAFQVAVHEGALAKQGGEFQGVFEGGMSGVAFAKAATVLARVTHGCQAISAPRQVTDCHRNVVKTLNFEPALAMLLRDLGLNPNALTDNIAPDTVLRMRQVLVAIEDVKDTVGVEHVPRRGLAFTPQTRVRHLLGIDPPSGAVAVAEHLQAGQSLAFCERNVAAARKDLMRICAELREALEPQTISDSQAMALHDAQQTASNPSSSRIQGAVYVSCAGRGGPHFGGPNAELQIIRHALGDVPLVGFFAGGEIAHQHVHGYTGVLLVFSDTPLEGDLP